jgi:uncharacterized protein YbaP (TraB family)
MSFQSIRLLLATLALSLGGSPLWAQGSPPAAPAAAACPPTAQMPTQEQMQAAMAAARDRGVIWRIEKDGRSSYLYGTMHLGRMEWSFPGPLLREALRNTDTLALELDLTDPAVLQKLQSSMGSSAASGGAAAPPLSDAVKARIARQAELACIPMQMLASLHPVMQVVTLTSLAGRWDGLDPSFAQEFSLAGFARASGRPIVSLETVGAQASVLIPGDPAKALRSVEQALKQLEDGTGRRVMQRLAQVWESGSLEDIENYQSWCECANTEEEKAFLKRLNDDRNPALAEGIDKLHAEGKRVLAGVGALHMTGAKALPQLMASKGYAVTRLLPAKP